MNVAMHPGSPMFPPTKPTASGIDGDQRPANDLFLFAADYYERYRVPYSQEVFDWVINEHQLDGRGRLLDVGCGTGQVALPLSQWFDEVIAIDPDQQMLQIGERTARQKNITNVRFVNMRAEEISSEMSPLRLVTFGASFHWMDRVVVAGRIYELLEPGGGLVILAPSSIWRGAEHWKEVVIRTIKDWLGEERRAGSGTFKTAPLHEECLAQTLFADLSVVDIHQLHVWTADSLIGYLYSTSFASKAVLGHLREPFEKDLRNRLAKLATDDRFSDQIEFTIISGRKPR
jgi:FkbM family methyltransferase